MRVERVGERRERQTHHHITITRPPPQTHTTKHQGGDTIASALWLTAFSTWLADSKSAAPRSGPNLHKPQQTRRLTCTRARWIYTTWRHAHGSEVELSRAEAASSRHVPPTNTSMSSRARPWSSCLENKVVLVQVTGCIDNLL